MNAKNTNIETLRNTTAVHYEFPHYALVEIEATNLKGRIHIPLPFFEKYENRIKFVLNLPVSDRRRDEEFFSCPICRTKSYYAGVCQQCEEDDNFSESFVEFNRFRELQKRATKGEILCRIDAGAKDLGIKSASIILDKEDDDATWNLPYPDVDIPYGEIISEIFQAIDYLVAEGEITRPMRIGKRLIFSPGDRVLEKITKTLGYNISEVLDNTVLEDTDIEYKSHCFCSRCGAPYLKNNELDKLKLDICPDCARADPVTVLKAAGKYETGHIYISEEIMDPNTIENLTRYREVRSRYIGAKMPAVYVTSVKYIFEMRCFAICPKPEGVETNGF